MMRERSWMFQYDRLWCGENRAGGHLQQSRPLQGQCGTAGPPHGEAAGDEGGRERDQPGPR